MNNYIHSILKTKASEQLEKEIEQQLEEEKAKAEEDKKYPPITELINENTK